MNFKFTDRFDEMKQRLRIDAGSDALYDALATEIIARKRRDSNVAFLAEIDNDFDKLSSPSEIMDAVGEKIARYFGISFRLTFSEFDKEKNKITVIYDHPSSGMENALGSVCLLEYFSEDLLRDMENGHIIAINDMSADPRTAAQSETYIPWGIRSELLAPYVVEGRLVFVIAVQHNKPYCWCKDEIEFFQDLSGRIYRRLDRARIEEALRQSRVELERQERFFDAILSNTVDFVCVLNRNMRFVYANQPLKKVWGLMGDNYIGKTLAEMDYEPALRGLLLQQIERVFETKEVISDEVPYASPSGRFGYWTHILSPVVGTDGSVEFVISVARDTTERKQMEEDLRRTKSELEERVQERTRELIDTNRQLVAQGEVLKKSEARACQQMAELESLYQSAPVGLCVIDADLRYIRINERFAEITGVPVADHIGRTLREIVPFLADQTETYLHQIFESGEPVWNAEFIGTALSQPGVVRTWIGNLLPLRDTEGHISGVNVVIQEITERKRAEEALRKSEERLRLATEAADMCGWEVDLRTKAFKWSKNAKNVFDFPMPETLADAIEAISSQDRDKIKKVWAEAIQKVGEFEYEQRFLTRCSNEVFWAYTAGVVLANSEGVPVRVVGVTQNITERKKAQEELKNAYEEIKKLNAQLEAENIYLREKVEITDEVGDIIGVSNAIRYVTDRIKQVAQTDATVLLTGETGTGKGLFARALYKFSTRKANPFVHVNCAGLPPNLIESELFGREKGAFTGSTNRQIGRFELAQGGTIFLDEIGELPLELQAKLLKVIEEGELERLGSPHPIKVDVRIIASTNRNLEEEIKKGRFRIDLFYRLSVFPVTIPPLRQRREDILLLVNFFIERFGKKHGKNIKKISHDTIKALENYDWPGNVRELMHVIERAIIVCDGPMLRLSDNIGIRPQFPVKEQMAKDIPPSGKRILVEKEREIILKKEREIILKKEREIILKTLHETGWKIEGKGGAAQIFGMNPSTLRGRMRKLGIKRPSVVFQ